jgi:hypothetical protein
LTKAEARRLIKAHVRQLDKNLGAAVSQFQIRMCYVNAHDELLEIAKNIVDKLEGETE